MAQVVNKTGIEVIKDFINGISSRSDTLVSDDNKLYRNGTIIAQKIGSTYYLNMTLYDKDLSGIQVVCRHILQHKQIPFNYIKQIPLNTTDLKPFIK